MTATLMWHAPWLLAFIVLPLLIKTLHRMRSHQQDPLVDFAARHLWPALVISSPLETRTWVMGAAWCLATVAAAGPYLSRDDAENPSSRVSDVVFVLDISPSMAARDTAPSRLQRAKWLIERISTQRQHNRFALIAFSANAYPVVPFTEDLAVLRHFTQALSTDMISQSGSNLARALERAAAMIDFDDASIIVVLSDGETHTPGVDRAADTLQARGIPVVAVTIGSRQGAPLIASDGTLVHYQGKLVVSRADDTALIDLANRTTGIALTENNERAADVEAILTRIDKTARHHIASSSNNHIELFPWLLIPSLILVGFWLHRARLLVYAVILVFITPSPPASASPWIEESARQALQQSNWERAAFLYSELGGYIGNMGQGAIAFRLGKWNEAAAAFDVAMRMAHTASEQAMASYNIGNAHARAGHLALARIAYQTALELQPNFSRATHNLNLITEAEYRASLTPDQAQPKSGADPINPYTTHDGLSATDNATPPRTNTIAVTELDRENTSLLLQRRFLKRDTLDHVGRNQDKPW